MHFIHNPEPEKYVVPFWEEYCLYSPKGLCPFLREQKPMPQLSKILISAGPSGVKLTVAL